MVLRMCGFEAVEVRALACCRQLRGGASCASHGPSYPPILISSSNPRLKLFQTGHVIILRNVLAAVKSFRQRMQYPTVGLRHHQPVSKLEASHTGTTKYHLCFWTEYTMFELYFHLIHSHISQ